MDENSVIRRVVEGDVDAFRELVERYERPVFAFVGNMVSDRPTREDLAQEVFLAAYEHLESFDPDRGSFATWLFTIARNKTLKELERRSRRPTPVEMDGSTEAVAADGHGERELMVALDQALEELGVEERMTFVLLEFAGLSVEEVAKLEGVAPGSVRSRLSRGRARLREALGMEGARA